MTKTISTFLAKNRVRNDASNRTEFLQSLAEKRRRLEEQSVSLSSDSEVPSCARTDARTVDRDVQMKYDIARNEDGPLRRTLKPKLDSEDVDDPGVSKPPSVGAAYTPNAERHPGLDERLRNVETHFAINYGTDIHNVNV